METTQNRISGTLKDFTLDNMYHFDFTTIGKCPFCKRLPQEVLENWGFDDPNWVIRCINHRCECNPTACGKSRQEARNVWGRTCFFWG